MSNIIPLFSSHYSIGKSILTLEKPEGINVNKPISIIDICKTHELKELYLVETNMSGFIESYKNCKDNDISLRFGLKLIVCADLNDKSEASLNTESKVIIWTRNSAGYKDLIKIYSKAATDGFYYDPRIDWSHLNSMITDNLLVSIPSYSSFLHNNFLKGSQCIPEFTSFKPNVMISDCGLPFDSLIKKAHTEYAQNNNLDLLKTHPIYFYSNEHFDAYKVFRTIHKRSTWNNPKIDHFSSTFFNFEEFCNKTNKEFKV